MADVATPFASIIFISVLLFGRLGALLRLTFGSVPLPIPGRLIFKASALLPPFCPPGVGVAVGLLFPTPGVGVGVGVAVAAGGGGGGGGALVGATQTFPTHELGAKHVKPIRHVPACTH